MPFKDKLNIINAILVLLEIGLVTSFPEFGVTKEKKLVLVDLFLETMTATRY